MNSPLEMFRLDGPFTVAFKKDRANDEWHALALEFNLLGIGNTKDEALAELSDLFRHYMVSIIETDGPVRFRNPAPAEDWNTDDIVECTVAMSFEANPKRPIVADC